jgi:Cu-processing system permease protein
MRLRMIALVGKREVSEAMRSRHFVLSSLAFFLLSLLLSFLGLAGSMRSGLAGYDRTTASLFHLVLIFVPLLTLTLGGLGIAGEIEDGSLATLLSLPLTRGEVFAGKFAGMLLAIWAATLTGFGATGILVGMIAGGGDANLFVVLVLLTMLLAASTLAIGCLISASATKRAKAIAIAFAAWLFIVYLSDLGTIGLAIARELPPRALFLLAMLNPLEEARVLGTMLLSARLDLFGPAGIYALDTLGKLGTAVVLSGALAVWTMMPLLVGARAFRKAVIS